MRADRSFSLILLFVSVTGCSVVAPFWSKDANAVSIAQYDVMKKHLRNPDTARFSDGKVIAKYSYRRQQRNEQVPMTKYLVSFDVTAENAFGAKIKDGYCLALSITDDGKGYILDVPPKTCTRGGPDESEVLVLKALASWETEIERQPASN